MDDWYEMPDWLLYETWAGVKKSKYQEYNFLNYSASHVASFVYNYIRDRNNSEALSNSDFLPFDLTPIIGSLSADTAKILMKVINDGLIPPTMIALIVDCGLMETVKKLGKEVMGDG